VAGLETGPVLSADQLADHQADAERRQQADEWTLLDLLLYGGDTLAAASARLVRGVVPHLAGPVGHPPHSGAGTAPPRLDFVGGGIPEGADERADVLAQLVKVRLEGVDFLFQVSVGGSHV
jgi:hypothetical protein